MARRQADPETNGWGAAPPPPDPLEPPDPLADQTPPPEPAHAGYSAPAPEVEDIPSADDITVEESTVFGRKAIERILGGTLLEERRMGEGPQ